ncbi:MAG: gamma-glutamylcyclotransferase family protein [Silvibacterium sp.]
MTFLRLRRLFRGTATGNFLLTLLKLALLSSSLAPGDAAQQSLCILGRYASKYSDKEKYMVQGGYVFGYGSLIERASRTRTNPDAFAAWPARVTGYRRGWFHQFANNVGSTCTYLGAVAKAGATINGVIVGSK